MTGRQAPLAIRLGEKLQSVDGGCIEFRGYRNACGYGVVRSATGTTLAHRAAWEIAHGDIPEGMAVCHRCDNPPCCNPAHLFLGTTGDNNRDRASKGRGAQGERVHFARLTEDQVIAIRQRHSADGSSLRRLAREFGVSNSTIHAVLSGQTWKHLLPAVERIKRAS